MKKSALFSLALVLISFLSAVKVQAQAFGVGTNVISAGIGLGSSIATFTYGTQSPGFNLQYDRGIWEAGPGVVSLGGYIGIKDYKYGYITQSGDAVSYKWNYTVVGVRGAWHFTGLDIENLDLYGGVMFAYYALSSSYSDTQGNLGAIGNTGSTVGLSVFAGAKYYFAGNLGAFGELGFGANILSLGLSYKF